MVPLSWTCIIGCPRVWEACQGADGERLDTSCIIGSVLMHCKLQLYALQITCSSPQVSREHRCRV